MTAWLYQFLAGTPTVVWLYALGAGLLLQAVLRPAERGHGVSNYLLHARYIALHLAVIYLLAPTLYTTATAIRQAFPVTSLVTFRPSGSFEAVVMSLAWLFVADGLLYWWHRAQHSIPALWDQHSVHHSDEQLAAFSGMRQHWSEFALQTFIITLPMMFLIDLPAEVIGSVVAVIGGWVYVIHSNIRLYLGSLAWVVAGPQLHRIHHSRLPEHANCNFAAYFPIWDVAFGTYHRPARDEYPPTGVDGVRLGTVAELSVYPFQRWLHRLKGTQ